MISKSAIVIISTMVIVSSVVTFTYLYSEGYFENEEEDEKLVTCWMCFEGEAYLQTFSENTICGEGAALIYKYTTEPSCSESHYCGDGTCDIDENPQNCPADCSTPGTCGDGICNGDETETTCPQDCSTIKCYQCNQFEQLVTATFPGNICPSLWYDKNNIPTCDVVTNALFEIQSTYLLDGYPFDGSDYVHLVIVVKNIGVTSSQACAKFIESSPNADKLHGPSGTSEVVAPDETKNLYIPIDVVGYTGDVYGTAYVGRGTHCLVAEDLDDSVVVTLDYIG